MIVNNTLKEENRMKTKVAFLFALVVIIAALIPVTSWAQDEVPAASKLTAYMWDGHPTTVSFVYENEYLLPPSWLEVPITPALAKAYFAVPAGEGYVVFKVQLHATWTLTEETCNPKIWRYPCPTNGVAYDAIGSIKYVNTFPAYAMLSNYDNFDLIVATFPDVGPAQFVCTAPETSTYQNCLRVVR